MRNPHVVALSYRLVTEDGISYAEDLPAVLFDTPQASASLENGILRLELKGHHDSVDEARQVVASLLRAWEVSAGFQYDRDECRFVFANAELIDLDSIAGEQEGTHQVVVTGQAVAGASFSVAVIRAQYPAPPDQFQVSPLVESLWGRYVGFARGREPLPSMAYFCLSTLQVEAGGLKEASKRFGIQFDVLRKMGELSSTRGDATTARKAPRDGTIRPLTNTETRWLRAAVKGVIQHLGHAEAVGAGPVLTMADLPPLDGSVA